MSALILAGAACALFNALVLGVIEVLRWRKFHQKPHFLPAAVYTVAAAILMIGADQWPS